ncbi:MAG: Gx transporter family protein [Eubacteriales bacterium]
MRTTISPSDKRAAKLASAEANGSPKPKKPSPSRKISLCAVLCAAALMLSYIESFIPASPFPGMRLGLFNIAVLAANLILGFPYAIAVSAARCVIAAVLFAQPTAFIYSAVGSALSLAAMAAAARLPRSFITPVGISVLGAAAHNCGQMLACALLLCDAAVFSYLPVMLIAAVPLGAVCGALCSAAMKIIYRLKILK